MPGTSPRKSCQRSKCVHRSNTGCISIALSTSDETHRLSLQRASRIREGKGCNGIIVSEKSYSVLIPYLYVPEIAVMRDLACFIEREPRDDWQFQMKGGWRPEGEVCVLEA